jgi:TRAP-type C4-dicarboxylate transport system permease small subunit
MKRVEELLGKLTTALSLASYVGFFSIMLLIVVDVFLRYVFSRPILGSYEIVERAVFCSVFASFAFAQTHKAHINISMLVDLFPVRLKMFCMFATGAMSSTAAFLIAYAATKLAARALASNYTTSVLGIPLYPFYWLEFLAMLIFGAALLLDALKYLLAMFYEEILQSVLSGQSQENADLSLRD